LLTYSNLLLLLSHLSSTDKSQRAAVKHGSNQGLDISNSITSLHYFVWNIRLCT